jgi:MoxR-like ATPase
VTHDLPRPFFVMATQNPLEMEGTYPLPEAQLDRFLFKVLVPFPSTDDLVEILERTTTTEDPDVSELSSAAELVDMLAMVREVPAANHLLRYASTVVAATHPSNPTAPEGVRRYVRFGASPRAAQAIVLGSKAMALVDGRLNAATEDVRAVAPLALRHRLVLGYEAAADGVDADAIIDELLTAYPAPVPVA